MNVISIVNNYFHGFIKTGLPNILLLFSTSPVLAYLLCCLPMSFISVVLWLSICVVVAVERISRIIVLCNPFPSSQFYLFNPFAREPPVTPVRIHVLSTLCDVIGFNGQGQLCPLTCAEWRDLWNHTRMSTIQSRTPEKEANNHVTLTWKSPWKSCCIAHLPFLSPNPKILKAFLKTIPTKIKPTKFPAREKKMRQEKRKKRGEEKAKSKSQDCCVSKFCFLRMLELRKLIFCIWIRRPWSVRPVNRFVVSFSSL